MVHLAPWRKARPTATEGAAVAPAAASNEKEKPPRKWNLGILSDAETDEVPGMLLSMVSAALLVLTDNSLQAPLSSSPAHTTAMSR